MFTTRHKIMERVKTSPITARIAISIIALAVSFTLAQTAFSEEKAPERKKTIVKKQVEGEIRGLGRDFIGVTYKTDEKKQIEYEIRLSIEDDIKVVHKKSVSEIKLGDIVRVSYDEVVEEYPDGPRVVSRKATEISFVKPAEKDIFKIDEKDREAASTE